MPKPVDYDLSQISAHVITYSDRIQRGTKEDRATPARRRWPRPAWAP